MEKLKLVSWNVNGIRAVERKGELQSLVDNLAPSILLIQETKGNRDQFSKYLSENAKFEQFYVSAEKKGYSGTGIWVERDLWDRLETPRFLSEIEELPNSDEGRTARLSCKINGEQTDIFSIYFPNGGKSEEAWHQKLEFYQRIQSYMNELRNCGSTVIVGGDMNVAHTEIDIARPKENDGKIGFHPDERAWMDRMIADGWLDIWRHRHQGVTDVYSYWDTITRARTRNVGWRIDYFLIDQQSESQVTSIEYVQEQMGSDHCPIAMEIGF